MIINQTIKTAADWNTGTKKMIDKILAIAEKNKEGFTIYLPSLEMVKHGWIIATRATQDSYGREGLIKVVDFAMKHNRIVGGYINEENGIFQFDASIVEPDTQLATTLMVIHNQDCIYNMNTREYIINKTK